MTGQEGGERREISGLLVRKLWFRDEVSIEFVAAAVQCTQAGRLQL